LIGLLAEIDVEETQHDDDKMLQEFGVEEGTTLFSIIIW
jgi:hypothetical protein